MCVSMAIMQMCGQTSTITDGAIHKVDTERDPMVVVNVDGKEETLLLPVDQPRLECMVHAVLLNRTAVNVRCHNTVLKGECRNDGIAGEFGVG